MDISSDCSVIRNTYTQMYILHYIYIHIHMYKCVLCVCVWECMSVCVCVLKFVRQTYLYTWWNISLNLYCIICTGTIISDVTRTPQYMRCVILHNIFRTEIFNIDTRKQWQASWHWEEHCCWQHHRKRWQVQRAILPSIDCEGQYNLSSLRVESLNNGTLESYKLAAGIALSPFEVSPLRRNFSSDWRETCQSLQYREHWFKWFLEHAFWWFKRVSKRITINDSNYRLQRGREELKQMISKLAYKPMIHRIS